MIRGKLRPNPIIIDASEINYKTGQETDFSVFWNLYNNKANSAANKAIWETITDSDKKLIVKSIPLYKERLRAYGQKPVSPLTYLSHVWFTILQVEPERKLYRTTNSFEEFWDLYSPKGNATKAKAKWGVLIAEIKALIIKSVPIYLERIKKTGEAQVIGSTYLHKEIWRSVLYPNCNTYGSDCSFEEFWDVYDYKTGVGNKCNFKKMFLEFKEADREALINYIPAYFNLLKTDNNKHEKMKPAAYLKSRIWANQR